MDVVVVTDIDSTLAHRGMVPGEHVEAVRELRSAGVEVFAATGRMHGSATGLLRAAGLDIPVASLNGAAGRQADDSVLWNEPFDPVAAATVVGLLGVEALCFVGDQFSVWASRDYPEWFDWHDHTDVSVFDVGSVNWCDAPPLYSACASFETEADVQMIAEKIRRVADVSVSAASNGFWHLDVTAAGVNKASAARRFAEGRLVVAVGDGGNDVAMLRDADVSVGVEGSLVCDLVDVDVVIPRPERCGWVEVERVVAELTAGRHSSI